jgi:hypothetical protein
MAAIETPENQTPPEPTPSQGRRGGLRGWVLIVIAVVLLIAILAFAQPFITILYNIVIPPRPPTPQNAVETRHSNFDYGVDEWWFAVEDDPCDVLDFYQQIGVVCTVTPLQCNRIEETTENFTTLDRLVARCSGVSNFSLFSMDWWVLVTRNPSNFSQTELDVWREINWLSTAPLPASTGSP